MLVALGICELRLLPELHLIATNFHKDLALWELWKAKPDLPETFQPDHLT